MITTSISKFSELIKDHEFFIPNYQRAYSWTEKEIAQFIADIVEHAENTDKPTQYYLGHYIIEKDTNGKLAIVDGQQRLTTVAIFRAVCQSLNNASIRHPTLRLNVVDYDNERFREILLPSKLDALVKQERRQKERTSSMERVVRAIETFVKSFFTDKKQGEPATLSKDKINAYLDVIHEAAVSVGVYKDKAVAAQIFELHNTRGVLLTETEKVKALLMKYVYLKSANGNSDVNDIQKYFAKVFELEEKAADASFRGAMSIDDILGHHLRAIDDGKDKALFTQPQSVEGEYGCLAYVRNKLRNFENGQSGVEYAKALAREFATSMTLISETMVEQDKKESLIGDVILLDQRRSMIFLLRYFRALPVGQIADQVLLKRWESFLFLWDWHDKFYNMKSQKKDSFREIFNLVEKDYAQVARLLEEYYSGIKAFAYKSFESSRLDADGKEVVTCDLGALFRNYTIGLENELLHNAHNYGHLHWRYKYWLYKYEIENEREMSGSDRVTQVRSSLRGLFKGNEVTLDHIVPRGLEWTELSLNGEKDPNIENWKDKDDREQATAIWGEIEKVINGIGNLILLSHSDNASIGNIPPFKRPAKYQKLKLESVSYREMATWRTPVEWQAKIEARGKLLFKWMVDYFTNIDTWTDRFTK